MDIAVGPVFGAHVVEVIAGRELAPVGDDVFDFFELLGVGFGFDLDHAVFEDFFDAVGFFEGVVLHGVASPGGKIAFGVGPGDEVGDIVFADGFELLQGFGWGDEVVFG